MDDDKNYPSAKGAWDGSKGTDGTENQNPATEKDGSARTLKPMEARSLKPGSFSPTGTIPVKRHQETDITVTVQTETTVPKMISLDRNDITLEDVRDGLNVLMRIDDEPSKSGMDGGRISRMTITDGKIGEEEIFAHFESGEWEKEPETFLTRQIVMDAKKHHNGLEQRLNKSGSDPRDNQRGRDRPDDGADMDL